MPHLSRFLIPLSVAAACAVAAPAAHAADTVTFPDGGPVQTTVQITDPGPASPTVHLTVTAADPSTLADTKVFLGGDGDAPYFAIGTDGVHDAVYDAEGQTSQLSTLGCAVYDGSRVVDEAPVTVDAGAGTMSADLPKGVVVSFESTGVAVGQVGADPDCTSEGFQGLDVDYVDAHQTIDGFSWDAPAAPSVTAEGGRRQAVLRFDREPGTSYDVFNVVGGVREADPVVGNLDGHGAAVPVTIDGLEPGTTYTFEVQATRLFNVWNDDGDGMFSPTSPFSADTAVTTTPIQALRVLATPAATTTDRGATFAWAIDANPAGDVPFCLLDDAVEVPCTTTGTTLTGLATGAHKLGIYPADGESGEVVSWTVTDAPVAIAVPGPAPVTSAPAPVAKNPRDTDGDGIETTWLIAGKPAAAPKAPTVRVVAGKVALALPAAPKGAKKVRVFRADGTGTFKLVKTVSPKAATVTDGKVKAGHTYRYKTVAVNAKGQQGKASNAVKAKVTKKG